MKSTDFDKAIMSIDIGVQHLGISVSIIKKYKFVDIIWIDLIDITKFNCDSDCKLGHTKTFCDWLAHIFKREKQFFDLVNVILIERQPPKGFTAIEQLIFYRWRTKAKLIAPRSVQKHFGMTGMKYDERKDYALKLALNNVPKYLHEQLYSYDRQHDIADTILMTLYWCSVQKEKLSVKILEKKQKLAMKKVISGKNFTMQEYFDAFRYIKKGQNNHAI